MTVSILRNAFLNDLLPLRIVHPKVRIRMLRWLGFDISRGADIRGGAVITGRDIAIGAGTYIGAAAFLDGDGGLTLGENCNIAPRVSFYTVTHQIGNAHRRAAAHEKYPVRIGNGVWVGAGSTIIPGVTIGDGCVIGAGSLVVSDCEPHGVYVGSPAKRTRDLPH